MSDLFISISTGLVGGVIGGFFTFFRQKQQLNNEIRKIRESNKVEYMAEETAKHFLNHKSFTDRSFDTLQKHLGGFEDNELRKILVRAGAIRTYRNDGSEWWRLLERMDEYIENKTNGIK